MSGWRRRLAGAFIRLYPRAWRTRYGAELEELVDATGVSVATVVDLARGAAHAWRDVVRSPAGGALMLVGPAWRHPKACAVASLVFALPTLLFVGVSVVAYQLAVPGIAQRMDPVVTGVLSSPPVELLLVGGPVVALIAALAPLVSYAPAGGGGAAPTISVRLLWPNAAAIVVSLSLVVVVGLYAVSEAVLEAAK